MGTEVGNIGEMTPMNPKAALVLVAFAITLGQPNKGQPEPPVPLPPAAAQVAQDFLSAFSRNDRDAIKDLLPTRPENLYGPCPFAGMPTLTNPRADTRTGAIDFQGPLLDSGLPDKGTIILRLVEENSLRTWRVRQIYWYEKLPKGADLPDRSPTAADRAQEPALRRAAQDFLQAWLAAEFERMDGLTFHWWEVPRRPPKWVKMKGVNLSARATTLGGLRVDFVAKLRVLGFLPKNVAGNVWLVEEDGQWRVRPLTFTFFF
ncbi:MAG: hypothetical protein JSV79_00180 [Armatimonadota bacterium]|nr:MAG: hypothetical protein JSV79_00180 [Armatimonadota bacterium]